MLRLSCKMYLKLFIVTLSLKIRGTVMCILASLITEVVPQMLSQHKTLENTSVLYLGESECVSKV